MNELNIEDFIKDDNFNYPANKEKIVNVISSLREKSAVDQKILEKFFDNNIKDQPKIKM